MKKQVRTHGWIIDLTVDDDKHLTVGINNTDKTQVSSLDVDIATNDEVWVERFTSEQIEQEYLDSEQSASVTLGEDDDTSSTDWQLESAIHSCEARIENGASTEEAFKWLRDEIAQINVGKTI